MNAIDTAIIVLNWNGRAFLKPCLDALFKQTYQDFEIVLVDNGSNDGSVEFVRANFRAHMEHTARPFLKVVELPANQGFSGGNIAGLAHCNPHAQFIATLNNDTVAEPAWLETLLTSLKALPPSERWGAVCSYLLFDNANQNLAKATIASAGIEVYRNGLASDRLVGQKPNFTTCHSEQSDPEKESRCGMPRNEFRRLTVNGQSHILQTPNAEGAGQDDQPCEIFGACAGAAIFRRVVFEDVGFFDAAFFAYLEDADLAWRMRLRGWRTGFIADPKAVVWHAHSGTGKQGSPFKSFQLGRNRLWVILKNMPTKLLIQALPSIIFYDLAASAYTLLKGDIHPLRGRLAALHPKHWQHIFTQRQSTLKYRTSTDAEIADWLLPPVSPLSALKLRRVVDQAAAK